MNKPHISIIVPVYNVAEYLIQCLDSCFTQTYTNLEVIAINDGSPDNCGEILDSYSQKEPRLRVIHQDNQGVAAARNVGIHNSSGEWLMFVDSDDCLLSNACQLMISTALSNNLELLVGGFTTDLNKITPHTNNPVTTLSGAELTESIILEKIIPSLWGKLFKRSLFTEIHHNSHLIKIGEDFLITLNALAYTSSAGILDAAIYFYRQRNDSVMNAPSLSATNSRLLFLLESTTILQKQSSKIGPQMVGNLTATLYIREFFSYLRDQGTSDFEPQIKNAIKQSYIHNDYMRLHTPIQRKIIVASYLRYPTIGRFLIHCLRLIKLIVRK